MMEICIAVFMVMTVALAIIAIASCVWFMRKCDQLIDGEKKKSNSWVDKEKEL